MTLLPMARWGFTMLLLLGAGGVLYVGGGAAYAKKVQGREVTPTTALASHPHHGLWLSLGGLVADGVVFSRALVSAWRAGEAYTAIPPGGGSPAAVTPSAVAAVATAAASAASSDSDSDGVVE